ncbi:MAG: hypothetical protein ACLFSB_05095 [Chitinispirillaceae bacterium]
MKKSIRRAFSVGFVSTMALAGCALKGTVVNISEQQTQIEHVHLKDRRSLIIYDGNGTLDIPLSAVQQVSVSAANSRVIGGDLFYPAQIIFQKNGTVLGGKPDEAYNDNRVYVCVADEICGERDGGSMCIPLDAISKIEFPKQ